MGLLQYGVDNLTNDFVCQVAFFPCILHLYYKIFYSGCLFCGYVPVRDSVNTVGNRTIARRCHGWCGLFPYAAVGSAAEHSGK